MKKIFTHLFAVLLLSLVTTSAWAQTTLENGCVYHFQNGYFTGRAITAVEGNLAAVNATATDQADIKQLWYATQSGDNWIFRNLYNGRYLSQTGSNNWGLTDTDTAASNVFTYIVAGDTKNTIRSTAVSDGNGYMHLGTEGQTNVAGWGSGSGGTQWVVTKKDYSADAITELLATAVSTFPTAAAFQAQLDAIFEDAACTMLNSTYSEMTEEQILADENYKALSTPLRDMVLKVKGGDWAEDNADATKHESGLDWETKYAKKFRVQMYEPYSIAGDITSWLGINAHANNDNPTGIYVPEAGYLYVMVEGEIKNGASLRLVNGGHNWRIGNATGDGYALSPGLNVINYTEATGMLYVCYNVDTYNPDGSTIEDKFPNKLSEYAPLKIHIEGGAINGYYNACGDFRATTDAEDMWKTVTGESVDCDADWEYMETRANLNVLPVLGHRQILLFQLEDTGGNSGMKTLLPESISVPTVPYSRTEEWSDFNMSLNTSTHKINIMMEAWDRIIYSEHATMGLLSDDDMAKMNDLFPRWKADKSYVEIYDYTGKSVIDDKTYREFCQDVDYSEYFNHHGVALGTETGYMYGGWDHCGYHINTFGSIVSKLAYEAGPTWGPAHEIGHQHQGIFNLNGQTEVTNNFFSNVAVWYMGMGTSRVNGSNGSLESVLDAYNTENNDAYTNNIWALTHIYYRLWLYYHLAGKNTQFWPRLFELLRNERLQNGGQISGDRSLLLFYKHACDAAGEDLTEFFRAHGYLEVMDNRLVGDYSNATYNQTQEMVDEAIAYVKNKWSEQNYSILFINDGTSETTLQHNGTDSRSLWDGSATAELGSVTDFIAGNTDVTAAYSATVSDDGTVTMSGGVGGVGFLILNDEGELVSFSNKSTFEISDEAAYLLATGKATISAVNGESETSEVDVDLSATRFALLQELINNAKALASNTSETRVGFYKPSAVENLQKYVTMAQEVIANGDLANLQAVYELLYAEYNAVVANEFSRVPLVPGSKYAILAKTNDRILSFSDTNVVTVAATENYASTANNQWYIERDGAFHIKNAGNSKYIQNVTDQNGVLYTVGDEVVNMNINEIQLGCYSIATSTVPGRYMNMDGADNARVITWGDTGNNSQWKFILLEENETNAAKEDLLELAKKTLALVNEVATVSYNEGSKIALQSGDNTAANYIWSNAPESGNNVDKLLDSDKNTFFHSQWNNSTAPTDGWGHHLTVDLGENPSLTSFKFKFTTRNQSNLSNYPKTIEVYGSADNSTYTKLQVASGFATGAGVDNEAVVMGDGTVYRYLRFLVTDATNSNSGTNTGSDGKVFFHMSEFSLYPITVTATVKNEYNVDGGVTAEAVKQAYIDAEQAKAVYNSSSATIDDITAKKTALQSDDETSGSYVTLLNQYNAVVNSVLTAKKGTLKEWVDKMTDLMKDAGTVNAQGPMSVDLAGKLYAHKPYTAGGESHSDYSSVATNYNLLDSNTNTYFHSDYSSDMPDVPYIRVDLGEEKTINEFTFNYTTRSTGTGYPTTIKVYGGNTEITYDDVKDTEPLATFTTSDANNPMPKIFTSWTSTSIQSATAYRFFVFAVTTSSVNKEYNGVTRPYFVMSEFGFTECGKIIVNLTSNVITEDELLDAYYANSKANNLYTNAQSVAIVEQAITDLQAAYNKLYAAMNNTAALKANLKELIDNTRALYDKMADDEGNVNSNYSVSALENQDLVDALAQITAAQLVFENASATVESINTAYETLDEKYQVLLEVENANVAATIDKSALETLINQANTLVGTINDNIENNENYYAGVDGLALDELNTALQNAQDAVSRYYLTEEQYTNAYNTLNSCYTVTNTVVSADVAKGDLNTLITTMQGLLGQTTVNGAVEVGNVALQIDDEAAPYYIWSNAPASDCNSYSNKVQGLIDVNTDGSANTGTFFGTVWLSSSEAYSHYVEIDLGVNTVIEDFAIDYTTRYSGAADSRPTGLKFYGSNDKKTYTELFSVTEGLPTTENTKWEMLAPHELAKNYRYIRVAVASNRGGCFNMSDFNLYSHCIATVKEFYSTSEIFDCLPAAMREYCDAKEAVGKYLIADDCTAAKEQLQAQIDALQAIINGNVTERSELEDLADDTEVLVTEDVATVDETETVLAMQCTDVNAPYYLYCNADGTTHTTYPNDANGVKALLDIDTDNHLHTTYEGEGDDDLDHYLRLDMGKNEAMMSFKFSYTGRVDGNDNAPKTMVIEGSNDLDTFDVIATLTNLPTTDTKVTYTTPSALGNGKAYRYIRFMVTETKNNKEHNGHPYFVLSQFSVTACKTIEVNADYASPNMLIETLATAYNEVVDANTVVDCETYVTQNTYDTAVDELQAAYDALNLAKNLKELPVILTTDKNNPVLYKIYINRAFNNSAVDLLAYDGASQVDVADLDFESTVQNWYFMQGTDENSYGDVLILPASAGGKALATNSFSEGAGKVSAQESAAEGYSYNWEINQIADKEWYNIKMNNGSDTYYYFSNHSGSGNKMGFYNSNTSTDGGSMFRFVLADAYSVLKDCYDPLEKEPEVYAPGYFSNAEQYNTAYDVASEYVNCANGTEEQYIEAYNELFAQKKALTTRTASHSLEDGAVYRIMNLITNTTGEKYHYIANRNAAITFPTTPAEDNSDLWVCKANEDGTYEFVSALGTATLGWNNTIIETNAGAVKENATKFVVDDNASVSGAKRIAEGTNSMSLTNELWNSKGEALFNKVSNDGKAQSENWSTDWYFQKVEDADVKFNVNISSRRFSSLYLPYDVEVPEGVGAFTAVAVDGTTVELVRVADKLDSSRHGTVVPARTPVILYIEDIDVTQAGSFEFAYTTDEANLPDDVKANVDAAIIHGHILKTPILCENSYRYYKLGGKSGDTVSKMYWMWKEYGSDGVIADGNAGTDNGGYISCSANKIYMKVAETLAANSFSMRFGADSGTTGVDGLSDQSAKDREIYDLQGRKLSEITEPGIYIVNGKKVHVK